MTLLLGLTALIAWPDPAAAVDYDKIDRTIAKEPVYQFKSPMFGLLIFGPDARVRVWVIADGDDLYVDRNANGDLTEEGERLTLAGGFRGDIVQGQTTYTGLSLLVHKPAGRISVSNFDVKGKYRQTMHGAMLTRDPKDAPVIHLDGPLTMGLHNPASWTPRGELIIDAWIGTKNSGPGTRPSMIDFNRYGPDIPGVPRGIHPVAEVEFPNNQPDGKPITVHVPLTQRT